MDNEKKDILDTEKVHKTTDYDKFKIIESNRKTSRKHVMDLVRSMIEHPELVPTRPILVNKNMEVLDGQHRLLACIQLGLPIYYTIMVGGIEVAQIINSTQRGWKLLDFGRSYALTPIDPEDPDYADKVARAKTYKRFLALLEEYELPPSVLAQYCEQRVNEKVGGNFRAGKLRIPDEEVTRVWLDQLVDIRQVVDKSNFQRGSFLQALLFIFMLPDYDHERMMKKIRERRLEIQPNRASYIRNLERLYNLNYVVGEKSYVRFF